MKEKVDKFEMAFELLEDTFPSSKYPDVKVTKDDATLLASHLPSWGGLLEVQNTELKKILEKFPTDLEMVDMGERAPYWAKMKLKEIQEELDRLRDTPRLIGRQNTNHYETKVILVNTCHQIWHDKTRRIVKDDNGKDVFIYKEAPYFYQQESHPFTKFVANVIDLHGLPFSARSAIEAFSKYFP